MSIYLTAIVKAKIAKRAELKTILLDMVSKSRREDACIQYDLHEDIVNHTFIFHEEWSDQIGLNQHNQQSYILNFVEKSVELSDGITIYKTDQIA